MSSSLKNIIKNINWDEIGFDPELNEYIVKEMVKQRFFALIRKNKQDMSREDAIKSADHYVNGAKKYNFRMLLDPL